MTTFFLYKKTHLVTGLKYLGKTTKADPKKYKGSGVYWTAHCKKYGYDVSTEILKECSSLEELRQWGMHYSKLWNVVESSEWANLCEENGSGGNTLVTKLKDSTYLKECQMRAAVARQSAPTDKTLYTFKHKDGRTEISTRIDMIKKYGLPSQTVHSLIHGIKRVKSVVGWTIIHREVNI